MSKIKPSIPSGTRDFSPEQVAKRNYIFNTIRSVFEKYGFQPIETPAMENLSTLTGKYGNEGDKLIFKILNSGDFLSKATEIKKLFDSNEFKGLMKEATTELKKIDFKEALNKPIDTDVISPQEFITQWENLVDYLSEKALRYDLTVPFARYVVQHQNEISFPFKRYQIQPVWRADRPQKGRYREFWQCDADIIGSDSLLNEVELIQIYDEVFSKPKLGFEDFTIRINNRKVLAGFIEACNQTDNFHQIVSDIDKADKVHHKAIIHKYKLNEFPEEFILNLEKLFSINTNTLDNTQRLNAIKTIIKSSEIGMKGVQEVETVLSCLQNVKSVQFDCMLARGLNYYTGVIMEVKLIGSYATLLGSLGGGGRYDNLTGMFGLENVSGVGISFGADRIYDAMEELKLFPKTIGTFTKVLFINSIAEVEKVALQYLQKVRQAGINSEIYPSLGKVDKQFKYAEKKKIPFVVLIDSKGTLTLKNITTGEKEQLTIEEIIEKLKT